MVETKIEVTIDAGEENVTGGMQKRMGWDMCVCYIYYGR